MKEPVNMRSAKVFIQGAQTHASCIMEVKSDGTLLVTTGDRLIEHFNEDYDKYTKDISRRTKTKRLSKRQIVKIEELIKKAEFDGREITDFYSGIGAADAVEISVRISNNNIYTCYYTPMDIKIEKPNALQELTYYLVDISPMKIMWLTPFTKLYILEHRFCLEGGHLYVRVNERIYGIDVRIMISIAFIIGFILCLAFGKFATKTQKRLINLIPYVLCIIGAIYGLIMIIYKPNGVYIESSGLFYKKIYYNLVVFVYSLFTLMSVITIQIVNKSIKTLQNHRKIKTEQMQ
ncbi:MAG: hypothetical protein PHE51_03445 [Eubacteriales bacterium]|nr:hypothetical protein [Eubacteriales bacterium]